MKRCRLIWFAALLVLGAVVLHGCSNPINDLLRQFDEAIGQFKALLIQAAEDSQHFKRNFDAAINKLDGRIASALEDGTIGRAAAATAGPIGDEAKTLIHFVETRIIGYLNALIEALQAKRDEVARSGVLPPDTLEMIIVNVIDEFNRRDVDPFVGVVSSPSLQYKTVGETRVLLGAFDVAWGGFALKDKDVRVVGVTGDKHHVWIAPPEAMTVNTEFRATFSVQKLPPLPKSVESLALIWMERPNIEVASILLAPAPVPSPAPKLTQAVVSFRSRNVKYPTVAWNVEMTIVNGPKLIVPLFSTCGRGDIWEKNQYFHYTIPLNVETELNENSTVFVDLAMNSDLGGPVVHTYTSNNGYLPISFYSKTHSPKRATLDEIRRFGFTQRGLKPSHTKWDLRDPLRMVAVDWSGYVQLQLVHDGKVIQFDETELISFHKGQPKSGKTALRLQWKGNGVLMPHEE